MQSLFVFLGGVNGFLAVALGAFGAHGLKARVGPEMLEVYQTGVQYHTTHALALIAVGIAAHWAPDSRYLKGAGWLFLVGIILFSGSLYLLSVTGDRWLGTITPVGGGFFLIGWLALSIAALRA